MDGSGYIIPPPKTDNLGLILSQDPSGEISEIIESSYTDYEQIQSADGMSNGSEHVSSSESLAYRDILSGAVPESSNFNIVTYHPHNTYKVSKEEIRNFYINYCLNASDKKIDIGERIKDYHPLILNFQKFDTNQRHLLHMVRYIQKIILDNLNGSNDILHCVVLQDIHDKERIRIHFPNCVINRNTAHKLLEQIIGRLARSTTISPNPNLPWNKNITCDSVGESIELYKSCRTSATNMTYYCIVNDRGLVDGIDIFNIHTSPFSAGMDTSIIRSHGPITWLPIILSRVFNTKHIHPRGVTIHDIDIIKSDEPSKLDFHVTSFIDMLKSDRYETPAKWLTLARCIRDIYHNDKFKAISTLKALRKRKGGKAIDAIIDRRQKMGARTYRTHNMDSDTVINSIVYESSETGRMSIKTLAWLAKEDSPDQYRNWHDQYIREQIGNATNMAVADIAETIRRTYWLEIIWDSEAKKWLIFRTAGYDEMGVSTYRPYKWNIYSSDDSFKQLLLKDFVPKMEDLANKCREQLNSPHLTQINKNVVASYTSLIYSMINQIKGKGLAGIVGSCKTAFNGAGISRWMDENPNTVGMVGDTTMEFIIDAGRLVDFCVRKSKPEDYITKSLGVEYHPELNADSPQVMKSRDLMNKVYPDPEIRETINTIFASRLKGKNQEKLVVAMVGEKGNNGKSTVEEVVSTAFGDYSVSVPKEIITTSAKSGEGASPVLAQAVGARLVWLNELSDNDKIDGAQMKKISSNTDKVFVRFLYDNGSQKVVMFTPFLVSNVIPSIMYAGSPERKRLYCVPHDTEFTDDEYVYDLTEEEQHQQGVFIKDPFISDDKYSIAVGALSDWINHYLPNYIAKGIAMPEKIRSRTDRYWKDNDIFALFFNDCMEHSVFHERVKGKRIQQQFTQSDCVPVSVAFERFIIWHNTYYPGKANTRPDIDKFKTYLGYVLEQPIVTTHFFGVRMRSDFFATSM
jgi:hypothetical protein